MSRLPSPDQCFVAIPARNECDRIAPCLEAIAASVGRVRPEIVLLTNNTTDDTGGIAIGTAARLGLRLHHDDVELPPERSSAGEARRLAMDHASRLATAGALLITTDADGRVEPGWLGANLRAIEAGADAVCGMAIIDPDEACAIPQTLHDDDEREMHYAALLDELHALLDPDPADPWPRHSEESGASIAVRKEVFDDAGGVPPLDTGEDRALMQALRRIDARIRHSPEVRVTVSGRLHGRAVGGMADTMRRRMLVQDPSIDERLEPVLDAVRRAMARADLRRSTRERPFGACWQHYEAHHPRLAQRRMVSRSSLEDAIIEAHAFLRRIKGEGITRERVLEATPAPLYRSKSSLNVSARRVSDSANPLAAMNASAACSPVQGVSVSPVQLARITVPATQSDASVAMSSGDRKYSTSEITISSKQPAGKEAGT